MDNDHENTVSLREFFLVSLLQASVQTGVALDQLFPDEDGDSRLDVAEFRAAVEQMGFRRIATELFQTIDRDQSGQITMKELLAAGAVKGAGSDALGRFFEATRECGLGPDSVLDAVPSIEGWGADATDLLDVRAGLIELVNVAEDRASPAKPAGDDVLERRDGLSARNTLAVWKRIDTEADGLITEEEFFAGLRGLGFEGPRDVAKALFDVLDGEDGDGRIEFDRERLRSHEPHACAASCPGEPPVSAWLKTQL